MRNVKTFSPFLIYAMLQLVLLYLLVNFNKPPFSSVLVPLIQQVFGEPALHYPNFYIIISPLYSQMNIILSGMIGIIFVGMATLIFASNFKHHQISLGKAFQTTTTNYVVLFLIWVVVTAITLLIIVGLPYVLKQFLNPDYMIGRVFDALGLLLGIIVSAMFAYTTALVVLEQQKFFHAVSNTFSIFFGNAGTSFFLIAVPTAFYLPITFLSRRIDLLFSKFSPEAAVTVLTVGIFITVLSSYFQVGSITRFFLLMNESNRY